MRDMYNTCIARAADWVVNVLALDPNGDHRFVPEEDAGSALEQLYKKICGGDRPQAVVGKLEKFVSLHMMIRALMGRFIFDKILTQRPSFDAGTEIAEARKAFGRLGPELEKVLDEFCEYEHR